ncbi:MAG: hypothetical protein Q4B73_05410 [Lachnospiraceae bacterium]|nr:hypothetical protein [Lachnospiraceae bacterium]
MQGFIPRFVPRSLVLWVYDVLSRVDRFKTGGRRQHLRQNAKAAVGVRPHFLKENGYAEDQRLFRSLRYGRTDMAYAGCEILAVLNALHFLEGVDGARFLPALIAHFEGDGKVLDGLWGTSPRAMARFFRKRGFEVSETTCPADFDEAGRRSEVLILTFYNDAADIMAAVHTVCLTKTEEGFWVHNAGNGKAMGPYGSVTAALRQQNGGRAGALMLLGISRRSKWKAFGD